MSKAGGKKAPKTAASKIVVKDKDKEEDVAAAAPAAAKGDTDAKDEVSSNGDKKEAKSGDEASLPKPQSAGATTRDAAQKLLGLTIRQEWTPVEPVMKALEKAVAAGGDDSNSTPLAGVMDPVSNQNVFIPRHRNNECSTCV